MRNDGGVSCLLRPLNSLHGFRQRPDLVELNQNGIGDAHGDPLFQPFFIRHKNIVTHNLDIASEGVGEELPSVPVVFSQAVFNGYDGIFFYHVLIELDHIRGCLVRLLLCGHDICPVFEKGACRRIDGDTDILSRLIARLLNRLHNHYKCFFIGFEVRRKSAFITNGGVVAFAFEDGLEGMKNLRGHAQSFLEVLRADGHDHEFLNIDIVVGVLAAVNDVHHRDGDILGDDAADVFVKGQFHGFRSGLRACH